MIKVEHIDVYGFEAAIRGMRNPMNSWDKIDSKLEYEICNSNGDCGNCVDIENCNMLGANDLDLMQRLAKAGTEHRKYLRMITVTMDITAPLYWWKEFDTYKVGTVANSCSTMHKIHAKEFTVDDFSYEHLLANIDDMVSFDGEYNYTSFDILESVMIPTLNEYRQKYINTKNKKYWWQMIQLLPSSYNQKRTVMMNYETVFNIINQRSGHKLDEWREFVDVLTGLPYVKELKS